MYIPISDVMRAALVSGIQVASLNLQRIPVAAERDQFLSECVQSALRHVEAIGLGSQPVVTDLLSPSPPWAICCWRCG